MIAARREAARGRDLINELIASAIGGSSRCAHRPPPIGGAVGIRYQPHRYIARPML